MIFIFPTLSRQDVSMELLGWKIHIITCQVVTSLQAYTLHDSLFHQANTTLNRTGAETNEFTVESSDLEKASLSLQK